MLIINRAKRKNGAPHPRRIILIVLLLVIVAALGLFLSFPVGCALPNHDLLQPYGHLYYQSGETNYSLDLQTRQVVTARDQSTLNEDALSVVSPNRLWRASWRIDSDKTRLDLIIEDNKTGKEIRNLGHFAINATLLFWSPDSQWLILNIPAGIFDDTRVTGLWMIHYENREWRVITHEMDIGTTPRFSPTGAVLAYLSKGSIHLKEISDTKQTTTVFSDEKWTDQFVWSPDGQWLAYTVMSGGQSSEIWVVRADGTQAHAVVSNGAINEIIDWRR
jgi:hypothetical protein